MRIICPDKNCCLAFHYTRRTRGDCKKVCVRLIPACHVRASMALQVIYMQVWALARHGPTVGS